MERCLLYFNLPYDDIIKQKLEPYRLYHKDLKNSPPKGNDFITDMLNAFEKEKDGSKRIANIILLKVPYSQEFEMNGMGGYSNNVKDKFQIVGGYASDGWAASAELL